MRDRVPGAAAGVAGSSLPLGDDPRRQMVENGGFFQTGDASLDLRPAADGMPEPKTSGRAALSRCLR